MRRYYSDAPSAGMYLLGGLALGALAMYLLDPVQGNRRRALIRDKAYSAAVKTRKQADATSRDFAHRARGMAYEVRRAMNAMHLAGTRGAQGARPYL